jgi:hypothetical protein
MTNDDILDDLFHGCALAAYLDEMAVSGVWPPNCEATRRRAFRYYEEALDEKNGGRGLVDKAAKQV